ncbi:hypothetical protein C0995_014456 [Termitomyces sp. Mi166|nr:hypothetical protein C0995_014456 [Termitomyces sp. Mi166\
MTIRRLNARDGLRKEIHSDEPLSIHLSQIESTGRFESRANAQPTQSHLEKGSRAETMAISVDTLVEKIEKDDCTDSLSTPGLAY